MADKTKPVVLYPSSEFPLNAGNESVPLPWGIAYLQQLQRNIPLGSGKNGRIAGWKGVTVEYDKLLAPEEVLDEELAVILSPLEALVASGKGLSKAELIALVASLKTL